MKDAQTAISTQSILSERRLTLNLVLSDRGDVDVRSCEVISKTFRNRTTFPDFRRLETVVVEKLAQAVRVALKDLPEGAQVLSLPDFLIELPGLVLSGVHLLVTNTKGGVRNAIFRFKEFLGAVNEMFLDKIGFNGSSVDHNERLATHVLTDICLPLLNLCSQMEHMMRDVQRPVHTTLKDRAKELEFNTELLKRFIFNSASGNPEAPQQYIHAEISNHGLLSDH